MFKKAFALVLVVASTLHVVVADPIPLGVREICGTDISVEQLEAVQADFEAHQPPSVLSGSVFNVHFHIINSGPGIDSGNVPDQQIIDQVNVLNDNFAPSGIRFNLGRVNRISNSNWFYNVAPNTLEQNQMKAQLRTGGPRDLNVYTVSLSTVNLLGYATFPWEFVAKPWDDGVVLKYTTFPGGSELGYNLGKILTHEVGHWVGLLHTFQGGCDGPGDYVNDTPAEAYPASGCPVGRDTCPGGGPDPIHNYMDYTDNACFTHFTPGQINRAHQAIEIYRRF